MFAKLRFSEKATKLAKSYLVMSELHRRKIAQNFCGLQKTLILRTLWRFHFYALRGFFSKIYVLCSLLYSSSNIVIKSDLAQFSSSRRFSSVPHLDRVGMNCSLVK